MTETENTLDAAALTKELRQPLRGKQRLTLDVTVNKIVPVEGKEDEVKTVTLGKFIFNEPPPDGSGTEFLEKFKTRLQVLNALRLAFTNFLSGGATDYSNADTKMIDITDSAERAALGLHAMFFDALIACEAELDGKLLMREAFDELFKVGDSEENVRLLVNTFYKYETLIGLSDAEAKN